MSYIAFRKWFALTNKLVKLASPKHSIHLSKNNIDSNLIQIDDSNLLVSIALYNKMVGLARVELATPRLSSVCSNHWATSPLESHLCAKTSINHLKEKTDKRVNLYYFDLYFISLFIFILFKSLIDYSTCSKPLLASLAFRLSKITKLLIWLL